MRVFCRPNFEVEIFKCLWYNVALWIKVFGEFMDQRARVLKLLKSLEEEIILMLDHNDNLEEQNKELLTSLKKYLACVKANGCEDKIKLYDQ